MSSPTPVPGPFAGLRIGYTLTGDPKDPADYSGTPASLCAALERGGAQVVGIDASGRGRAALLAERALALRRLRPGPEASYQALLAAQHGETAARLRTARVRRKLASAGRLDGVIQQGTDHLVLSDVPVLTFDDVTFAQADDYAWHHVAGATRGDRRRWHARAQRAYDRAHACLAMTHWTAVSLVEDFGVAVERAPVVGIGRNRELAPPVDRDWTVPRFLLVGFDFERKNGPRVLRAFTRLLEEWPDAELHVVGRHPALDAPGVIGHGELRLDVAEERSELEALYERATCFVMPSLHEPAGIVYTEAGAVGIPSIGTTSGGAATIIGDGGHVVDPLDDEALLDAMRDLARAERARALGALALERSRLFTWDLVAQRVVRALAPAGVDVDALAQPL